MKSSTIFVEWGLRFERYTLKKVGKKSMKVEWFVVGLGAIAPTHGPKFNALHINKWDFQDSHRQWID